MFCTNCGKQIPDDAKFCTGCGKPVGGAAPVMTAPAKEKTVQAVTAKEKPVQEKNVQEKTVQSAARKPAGQNSIMKKLGIFGLIDVIMFGCAAFYFFVMSIVNIAGAVRYMLWNVYNALYIGSYIGNVVLDFLMICVCLFWGLLIILKDKFKWFFVLIPMGITVIWGFTQCGSGGLAAVYVLLWLGFAVTAALSELKALKNKILAFAIPSGILALIGIIRFIATCVKAGRWDVGPGAVVSVIMMVFLFFGAIGLYFFDTKMMKKD